VNNPKIKVFTDLITWQKAHSLVLSIYKITNSFPRTETYVLVDQMKRCSISITSNIAEGFSRKGKKEKIQFYYMALGSTTELQSQLMIGKDLNYLSQKSYNVLLEQIIEVHKLLNSLIKSSQSYS
jgi:four helix bundle protein